MRQEKLNHDQFHSIPAESSPEVVRRQRAVAAVEGERNPVSGLDKRGHVAANASRNGFGRVF